MRPLTPRARRQVTELTQHDEALGRDGAIHHQMPALTHVCDTIEASGGIGLHARRPCPHLAQLQLGFRWLKACRYWFAFTPAPDLTITGIVFEAADIPSRLA